MFKFNKRLTALLVMVALLLTTSPVVFAEATANEVTTPSLPEGQVGLLRHLGILTEENPDYGKDLTRGELAHIAAKLSAQPEYTKETILFRDVLTENPYFKDIHALATAGIVSGDGNGFYRPDDPVSDTEACKVFAVILGYKEVGHFTGYFKTARTIGLTDGITMDGTMSYGDGLAMAYNTLHTEMFEAVSYGEDIEYRAKTGYYALEHYFNLVRRTGLIDGVAGTTLTHAVSDIGEGYIQIGKSRYVYDAEELIGQNVVFYGEVDDFAGDIKRELAYLYSDPETNNVLTVASKDIIGKKGNEFYYWKNNREGKVSLIDAVDVIYNGVAYPAYQDADWMPESGQVTLVDNNDDNVYDVAVIQANQYLVCQGVDNENQIIYGSYPQITIGTAEQDKMIDIRKGTGRYALEKLKNGDILAVRASKNTRGIMKIRGEILTDSVLGSVTEVSDKKIKVNDVEYTVTDATEFDYPVKVGETISIYRHGDVTAVILHASNDNYKFGYLLDAATLDSAFSSELIVKIVDNKREIHEYKTVDKLKLDEGIYTDGSKAKDRLLLAASKTYQYQENGVTKWPYSQPIRYRLNTEGLLTHIDTLLYEDAEGEDSLQQDVPPTTGVKYSWYIYNMFKGGNLIFTLPVESNRMMIANEARDDVAWYPTKLQHNSTAYVVEGYNVDPENYQATYAMIYAPAIKEIAYNAPLGIVRGKSTALDAEGYPIAQLEISDLNGAKKTCGLLGDSQNVDVSVGDIIQLVLDPNDNITDMKVLFDIEKGSENNRFLACDNTVLENLPDSPRHIAYGTILSFKNNIFTHTTATRSELDAGGTRTNLYNYGLNGNTKFYVYDTSEANPQLRDASSTDIVPYLVDPKSKQAAVMVSDYGSLKMVYIIK